MKKWTLDPSLTLVATEYTMLETSQEFNKEGFDKILQDYKIKTETFARFLNYDFLEDEPSSEEAILLAA